MDIRRILGEVFDVPVKDDMDRLNEFANVVGDALVEIDHTLGADERVLQHQTTLGPLTSTPDGYVQHVDVAVRIAPQMAMIDVTFSRQSDG